MIEIQNDYYNDYYLSSICVSTSKLIYAIIMRLDKD